MRVKAGGILALIGLGCLLGGMVFFGAIVAPAVFIKLPPEVAGPFIRVLFPFYYAYMAGMAALAALGLWLARRRRDALAAVALVAVTLVLWDWWLPQLEVWRLAGNVVAFNRGHGISVDVNAAQLLAALWLLVRAAI
ncbi:MAG: DUF4149 domain-containing protein [Acidocella sp.]|nr:DUF4149 domain-containing protein [Acidocella sp.]